MPEPTNSLLPSLACTSAPLLSNPVLTDTPNKTQKICTQSLNSVPLYPEVQWETAPTLIERDNLNCTLFVTTKVSPARLDTTERDLALRRGPRLCQEQADVLRLVGIEAQEHQSTMQGLKVRRLAQNRDVHLLALKKLIKTSHWIMTCSQKTYRILQSDTITRRRTCCSRTPTIFFVSTTIRSNARCTPTVHDRYAVALPTLPIRNLVQSA